MLVPTPVMTSTQHIIHTNNLQWVTVVDNTKIKNPVIAGNDDHGKVEICHAKFQDAMYPGHLTNKGKGCMITYSGKTKIMSNFQVLVAKNPEVLKTRLVWKSSLNISGYRYSPFYGVLPANSQLNGHFNMPVIGGYESQSPNYLHPLYICRVIYQNSITVGKLVAGKCNIAGDGQEQSLSGYQVLGMKVTRLNNLAQQSLSS